MDKNITFYQETEKKNTLKLREILKTLPPFVKDYFRAIEPTTSTKTRISYAYDLRIFFNFLLEENPYYRKRSMADITLSDLERIEAVDIEEYQEYLKVYSSTEEKVMMNTEKGLARKLSCLRSFYKYYYKHQMISRNPTLQVDMPKLHDKAIIRLEADEVASLLDYIEHCGASLKGQAKLYYEKNKLRDLAIVTLLLGTGIRVSECVGLNLNDIDFKKDSIKVTRKGGSEMFVYFGPEVEKALLDYLEQREGITTLPGHENALFLSTQKRRIGIQAVENLVKKYSRTVTPSKKITPHKLRSTYGTTLYKETGDIYLVADVLGHKDVNTTRKHYAALDDARRKSAASAVILREQTEE